MFLNKTYEFRGVPFQVAYMEPSPCHASWFSHEDESAVRDRDWHIGPDDVVFDVGAAYGSYSLTALAMGASKVFAWSPQGEPGLPTEREFFMESIRLNGWGNRCEVMESGVYDKTGWLNASTQEFSTEPLPPSVDVIYVSRLDDWYKANLLPDTTLGKKCWLKLDVEGAEVEVFKGAKEFITEVKPTILVELHLFKDPNLGVKVRELLESYGYEHVSTHPYHSVAHSVYAPNSLSGFLIWIPIRPLLSFAVWLPPPIKPHPAKLL
jgi:FkbM family methyltransferase